MTDLLIGCPIHKRAWIVPEWFAHVRSACEIAKIEPEFAFVLDPRDEETIDAISAEHGAGYVFAVEEKEEHGDKRVWNRERFLWMVELRNELLGVVRLVKPHLFLSLDSDILLHQDAILNLLETIEDADAVGGKAYMTDVGTNSPSWANLSKGPGGGLKRSEVKDVVKVQILMAIKLMRESAYNVDYEYSRQGEDIGWSLACGRAGLKLMFDGRVANKHVMNPGQLHKIDERVGF